MKKFYMKTNYRKSIGLGYIIIFILIGFGYLIFDYLWKKYVKEIINKIKGMQLKEYDITDHSNKQVN